MFKRVVDFVRRNKKVVIAIVIALLAILFGVLYSSGSFGASSFGASSLGENSAQLNGVYAIDGCGAESQRCVDPAAAVYSIRCCSDSKAGISVCPSTQGNYVNDSVDSGDYTGVNDATFAQAKKTCESKGYRLCTVDELANSPVFGTTCERFNNDQAACNKSSHCEWVGDKCGLKNGSDKPGSCSTGCLFNGSEYTMISGERCEL